MTKSCTGCGAMLPADPLHFQRCRRNRDGLYSRCKDCTREYDRQRWANATPDLRQGRRDYFDNVYYPRERDGIIRRVMANKRSRT